MASQAQETQGHRVNEHETALLHSSSDPHSTVLEALVTMSHLVFDAYNTLKIDKCVPSTDVNVCHQKQQELADENEKLKTEAQLYQLNNYNLRARLDDTLRQLRSLDDTNQEMKKKHDQALRNAADRIVDQDRKIDELVAQAKAKDVLPHETPVTVGKRGRPVNHEYTEDMEGSRKRSKNEVGITFGQ